MCRKVMNGGRRNRLQLEKHQKKNIVHFQPGLQKIQIPVTWNVLIIFVWWRHSGGNFTANQQWNWNSKIKLF